MILGRPKRTLFDVSCGDPCFAVREVMGSRPSAASRPYPISCPRVAAAPTRTFRSAADVLSAAPLFGKDFGRIHYNPIATVFGGSSPIPFANFSQLHPILPIQLSCSSLQEHPPWLPFPVRLIPSAHHSLHSFLVCACSLVARDVRSTAATSQRR
jgi:hypothetical protein